MRRPEREKGRLPKSYYTFPFSCCGWEPGQGPVQVMPMEFWFWMLEHRTLAVPPSLGLISMFSKWKPSQGAEALQWMATATLYRLVPVMFCQVTSVILRRDESQLLYESGSYGLLGSPFLFLLHFGKGR